MGATGLHVVGELLGLRCQGVGKRIEGRQQVGGDLAQRGEMNR
jgi:hypothetical protein